LFPAALLALVALIVILGSPGASHAQEDDERTVRARINNRLEGKNEPVDGVTVTISVDDEELASGETDDTGTVEFTVQGRRDYTVTVDTAEMLESNPVFRGQDAATLGLPAELTSEVYVDSENRPVRIQVELGEIGSFDAHFSDYGKDVSVEAPDPSTVGEFSL